LQRQCRDGCAGSDLYAAQLFLSELIIGLLGNCKFRTVYCSLVPMNISRYFQNLKYEIKALLFDWGDTVMKVFPGQTGPMTSWSEVAAVEGINDLLPILKERYQIILVSNAQDSNREQVWDALEMVNLAQYFHQVFSPKELNARKPAPDFYLNILKQIEVKPENAIMIGDDYEKDIIGAKQVGLWTIWFNPGQKKIENSGFPYHDLEIHHIGELYAIIHQKMNFR
jgi:HAD superfamily hydrolase (TIGR01662 family)